MKKKHKGVQVFLMTILVPLALFASIYCTSAETEDITKEAALRKRLSIVRGNEDFSGYCGRCTAYQLGRAGIFPMNTTAGNNGWNGKDCNDNYKEIMPGNGMSVTLFPGENKGGSFTVAQVCNLLNESNLTGENTYTIFCYNKGSYSDMGQKNGHVLLVHSVYDGKVYWGEAGSPACNVDTIENFIKKNSEYVQYGKTCRVFDGAISYSYTELCVQALDAPKTVEMRALVSTSSLVYVRIPSNAVV